jgi:DNA invertase Pin-like site-specific DNA recombinase
MPKTIAYLRVSTDRQDVNNQRLEILDYARRSN